MPHFRVWLKLSVDVDAPNVEAAETKALLAAAPDGDFHGYTILVERTEPTWRTCSCDGRGCFVCVMF